MPRTPDISISNKSLYRAGKVLRQAMKPTRVEDTDDDEFFEKVVSDFLDAHPEVTMQEVCAREEQWSRDTDPFHGIFR